MATFRLKLIKLGTEKLKLEHFNPVIYMFSNARSYQMHLPVALVNI